MTLLQENRTRFVRSATANRSSRRLVTQEGLESFIGVFIVPEITMEHAAPASIAEVKLTELARVACILVGPSPDATGLDASDPRRDFSIS